MFIHVSSCSHCFFQNDDFHFADAKKTSKVSRLHHRQKWQVQSSYPRHPPRLLTEPWDAKAQNTYSSILNLYSYNLYANAWLQTVTGYTTPCWPTRQAKQMESLLVKLDSEHDACSQVMARGELKRIPSWVSRSNYYLKKKCMAPIHCDTYKLFSVELNEDPI